MTISVCIPLNSCTELLDMDFIERVERQHVKQGSPVLLCVGFTAPHMPQVGNGVRCGA